ncbi:MAG: hypothetical protein ABSF70_06175 [Terracidiphilus sp.]|jgi:hypothetical protein
MSGFLQRVTGAAIARRPRLHPVVDSIYAAARRDEAPGFQFPVEMQTEVLLQQAGPRAKGQSDGFESASRHSRAASLPDDRYGESPMRSEKTQEMSSVQNTAERLPRQRDSSRLEYPALNFLESGTFQPLLGRLPAFQPVSETAAEAHSEKNLDESAAGYDGAARPSRGWVYEPVIVAGTPLRSQPADAPRLSEPATTAPALQIASRRVSANEAGSQRNAQSKSGAEDIQIHIGRIEVIAVPPPAERPAAATVRRGQSLDEYLSRSNGRSR